MTCFPELPRIACAVPLGSRNPIRVRESPAHARPLANETIKFREKGAKLITRPLPSVLAGLLRAAVDESAVPTGPVDYVIPMLRKQLKSGERDDRVIYRTVRRLAARAGVAEAHVHALRGAFAVHFLETHTGKSKHCGVCLVTSRSERRRSTCGASIAQSPWSVRDLSWDAPGFEDSLV
jgi:hypothetical protein